LCRLRILYLCGSGCLVVLEGDIHLLRGRKMNSSDEDDCGKEMNRMNLGNDDSDESDDDKKPPSSPTTTKKKKGNAKKPKGSPEKLHDDEDDTDDDTKPPSTPTTKKKGNDKSPKKTTGSYETTPERLREAGQEEDGNTYRRLHELKRWAKKSNRFTSPTFNADKLLEDYRAYKYYNPANGKEPDEVRENEVKLWRDGYVMYLRQFILEGLGFNSKAMNILGLLMSKAWSSDNLDYRADMLEIVGFINRVLNEHFDKFVEENEAFLRKARDDEDA
jgi:hypothetical protein